MVEWRLLPWSGMSVHMDQDGYTDYLDWLDEGAIMPTCTIETKHTANMATHLTQPIPELTDTAQNESVEHVNGSVRERSTKSSAQKKWSPALINGARFIENNG